MSILQAEGQDILKEIQSSKSVLVDCWAPWCPPCRLIGAVLEEIDLDFDLKIVKVNADENPEFISEFQVLGLPTLLLFQDGELVGRITGFGPKDSLVGTLKDYGLLES
ncbi:thioredoxin family protein [Paenibacillus sp. BSR1-1]|uniref:thioredoxin family protein n=1 Tax=Paenibacillus sp. BSR1-1 TaxID=3020845 RepID=UPI0025B07AFC|nr:thioredoxin family protein [Paenibacillus sp. BSR1-1]MDN3017243.1 thioredoxin family protein [Paenibacillus sp. BSR1-1]